MLADESLLDEHAKKLLVGMKEINDRMDYEAVSVAMAAVKHATRQAEQEARMTA